MNVKRFLPQVIVLLVIFGLSSVSLAVGDKELRGQSKGQVESLYGRPAAVIGPVGDPPITKWQYADITVVFEYDHVIHAYRRDFELEKLPSSVMSQRPTRGDTLEIPQ